MSRHLRMKVLAADFDLLPRRRIDHVAVIGSDLLVQALGRMRQSETIVEHLAGIDDCELAMAAYQFAVQRWPKAAITLRQGARSSRIAGSGECPLNERGTERALIPIRDFTAGYYR